jgi:hypothetical protein
MAYGFQYGSALTYDERLVNLRGIIDSHANSDSYPPIGDLEAYHAQVMLTAMLAAPPADRNARIY